MKIIREVLKTWAHKIGWKDAERLLAFVLKKNRVWLIGHGTDTLTTGQQNKFYALARRRQKHEPLAYLIGEKHFYGRDFLVNKHVLIPRPETEVMIDEISRGTTKKLLIWDVGTGSGVIAISLYLSLIRANRRMVIVASDMDRRALQMAKKNAHLYHAKIKFIQENLLGPKIKAFLRRKIKDPLIILANLPYLPMSDKNILAPDVVRHEPLTALFTQDNGMFLNKKLLKQLSSLKRSMIVLLEFDPPQTKTLKKYAHTLFPDAQVTTLKDQFKRDRFLRVCVT